MFDIREFGNAPSGKKLEIVEEMSSCLTKEEIEQAWKILKIHWNNRRRMIGVQQRSKWRIGDVVQFTSTKRGTDVIITIQKLNDVSVNGITKDGQRWKVGYGQLRPLDTTKKLTKKLNRRS